MGPTTALQREVKLQIAPDQARGGWQYHVSETGRRLYLHRGDTVSFDCAGTLRITFDHRSPFNWLTFESNGSPIRAQVENDAPYGVYKYTVDAQKGNDAFHDDPEIIIESTDV